MKRAMKKLLSIIVMLCVCIGVFAQATDLVIDNQTPGWLSSKINYGDQLTVKNLKVTGYINDTDMKFIGSLIEGQSLNGSIDLSDVKIVKENASGSDDYLTKNALGLTKSGSEKSSIQKFIFPKSLTKLDTGFESTHLNIDSLIFETQITTIEKQQFSGNINNIIIGEGVTQINSYAINYVQSLQLLELPQSLTTLQDFALTNLFSINFSKWNINTMPSLEYMGYQALYTKDSSAKNTLPDSISLPNIKEYHISCMEYKEGMHIFLGEDITNVYYWPKTSYSEKWFPSLDNVTFHIKSKTPPATQSTPNWNYGLSVFVPKDAVDTYKNHDSWKNANIQAEKEEEETGIQIIETNSDTKQLIYDLEGRLVNNPQKGHIYIINGKKVVVK